MFRFINTELKSDSVSDSEVESKSDAELMVKSKSDSDNKSGYDTVTDFFYLDVFNSFEVIKSFSGSDILSKLCLRHTFC